MTRAADQPEGLPVRGETFLQRWSRRKLAATRDTAPEPMLAGLDLSPAPAASPVAPHIASAQHKAPMEATPTQRSAFAQQTASTQHNASKQQNASTQHSASGRDSPSAAPPAPLPPIESLTFDSDFRAFLQPHVAEDLKRQALKKLLHDPRFNVMDGLNVYIDDYSVPSPLAADVARGLAQARYIFEPPSARVNAQGHVEDIPAPEADALGGGQCETAGQAIDAGTAENHATPPASAGTPPDAQQGQGDASR